MDAKRFLIMAGGTGGHVFPALATAQRLEEKGHEVVWLGSRGGMEQRLVSQHGIRINSIAVSGMRGKGRLTLLMAPVRLAYAIMQALVVVRREKPDCVLGMGGFVAGPGGVAAWLLRKPLVVHEQNAIAGLTNRWLSRFASLTLEAFSGAFGNGVVTRRTGNPVRQDLVTLDPPAQRMAHRTGPIRLLVIGGSRGARKLNTVVPGALSRILSEQRPQVWHQAGEGNEESTRARYEDLQVEANVAAFIEDMAEAYTWADLVICRAGALTVTELCAVGLGAILVPFPHAVDDHQTANAQGLVKGGAALLMAEEELTEASLEKVIFPLLEERAKLLEMAGKARSMAVPDATDRVVNYCLEAANG